MIKIEDLVLMEREIRDLEEMYEAWPLFIFTLKLVLLQAKKEAGITGPLLQPPEAPPVEAVAA